MLVAVPLVEWAAVMAEDVCEKDERESPVKVWDAAKAERQKGRKKRRPDDRGGRCLHRGGYQYPSGEAQTIGGGHWKLESASTYRVPGCGEPCSSGGAVPAALDTSRLGIPAPDGCPRLDATEDLALG